MNGLFKTRSIFSQLLLGGVSIMGGMVLLALMVNTYYLNKVEQASMRSRMAASIALTLPQLQSNEIEFFGREIRRRSYQDSGNSEALTKYLGLTSAMKYQIDTLVSTAEVDNKYELALRTELTELLETFNARKQIEGETSNHANGMYTEWNHAIGRMDSVMRAYLVANNMLFSPTKLTSEQKKVQSAYLKLQGYQGSVFMPNKSIAEREKSVDSMNKYARELASSDPVIPGAAEAIERMQSLFRRIYSINEQLGFTETDGLKKKLRKKGMDLKIAAQAMVDKTTNESDMAQALLSFATPAVLLIGLGMSIIFFYRFASSMSSSTSKLASTAAEVGRGNLNARVSVKDKNELGLLTTEFNRMAENLTLIVSSVRQSGVHINNSITELVATSQQEYSTVSEVASTTNEISATAKQISATSKELASNMKHVANVAERTATLAGSGQSGISRMEKTMSQIAHASESIGSRLEALSDKASNINAVVTTITKVADQTNLLSLNAAIEAEKAGEYGRGFSVVATEIRRLADQTAIATMNIEKIVKEMQSAVTAGVMGMDKFSEEVRLGVEASSQVGGQLSEIIHQVQTLTPNFEQINTGMQSQAEGAQQISESLVQLGVTAYQTAESLAQSAKSIEQLNDASRELQSGVARFSGA